jgi:hypothetical protein
MSAGAATVSRDVLILARPSERRRQGLVPIVPALLLLAVCGPLQAQDSPRGAATAVTVVSSDLRNFYQAFDNAQGKDSAERVQIFLNQYVRAGSPGLRDWTLLRLAEWDDLMKPLGERGWTMDRLGPVYMSPVTDTTRIALMKIVTPLAEESGARNIAQATARRPKFYSGIRSRVLSLDSSTAFRAAAAAGLARLAALYPQGELKPVYLLVGRLTSGGTVGASGMLLGAEMSSRASDVSVEELSETERTMVADRTPEDFVSLIIHEAVHTFQPADERNTLLTNAIREGFADFLAHLALPDSRITSSSFQTYGRAHEAQVRREFLRGMRTNEDSGNWLYSWGKPSNHGSADLGYFVGFRISEGYYGQAKDKAGAIRDLIALRDPARILRLSGYATRPKR